jgi:hypothetical protein
MQQSFISLLSYCCIREKFLPNTLSLIWNKDNNLKNKLNDHLIPFLPKPGGPTASFEGAWHLRAL